jgi:hypothetical protein
MTLRLAFIQIALFQPRSNPFTRRLLRMALPAGGCQVVQRMIIARDDVIDLRRSATAPLSHLDLAGPVVSFEDLFA